MDKLLLVDGSNLLFQMFYGMPQRIINSRGKAIHGTLGFIGALGKILRMVSPTHVAVLFDGECENKRVEMDPQYKANRPDYSQIPEEETPFSQLPDIYMALDYMSIAHGETTNCETDDWIAAYTRALAGSSQIVISSQDSDYFQLISQNVHILRYRGKNTAIWDADTLYQRFGIAPERYADFKALTGDASDNIKGVPGIGPKTAAMLINRFGSLEEIIANGSRISKPAIRESLICSCEQLRNNYRLIRLEGLEALPFPMESLVYTPRDLTTSQILAAIGLK